MSSITISPAGGVRRRISTSAVPSAAARVGRARTPLRLTQRGRTVLLSMLALPLAVALAVTVLDGGGATATMADPGTLEYVRVAPGQTLWGLATELSPGSDPRDVIDEIMRLNRLGSADLAAGQQLAIPPKYLR